MTYTVPCESKDNDPEDWFIRADGKQYSDDPMPGYNNAEVLQAWVVEESRLGRLLTPEEEVKVDNRVFADAKRAQLARRRHAREECFGCYFRTNCLDLAVKNNESHGTWGGYFEEDLVKLQSEIQARRTRT